MGLKLHCGTYQQTTSHYQVHSHCPHQEGIQYNGRGQIEQDLRPFQEEEKVTPGGDFIKKI